MRREIARVIVIDRQRDAAEAVMSLLHEATAPRYDFIHLPDANAALGRLGSGSVAAVLLAVRDAGWMGSMQRLLAQVQAAPVIALLDDDDPQLALAALSAGAQDSLIRSDLTAASLARAVRFAVARHRREHRDASLAPTPRDTESRIRLALANSPVTLATLDAQLRYTWIYNPPRNMRAQAFIGRRDDELAPPEHVAELMALERAVLASGMGERREVRLQLGNRVLYHDVTAEAIRDESGAVVAVALASTEITTRIHAEEALRVSERRYRSLIEHSLDGILLLAGGEIIAANPAACHLLGYSETMLRAIGRAAVMLPGDPRVAESIAEERRSGYFRGDLTMVRRDGRPVSVEVSSCAYRDATGREQTSMFIRDTTERTRLKVAERLLAEVGGVLGSSQDKREMLRRLGEVSVPHFADWCVIDVMEDGSPRVVEVVGPEDARGKRLLQVVLGGFCQPPAGVQTALARGEPVVIPHLTASQIDEMVRDPEHRALLGELDPRSLLIAPIRSGTRLLGVVVLVRSDSGRRFDRADLPVAHTLGERVSLAVERARLHANTRAAVEARDEVLGFVAHDLRSPLGAIALNASLLLDKPVDDEAQLRARLEAILRSTGWIERLIQDLLDVSRLECGQMRIELERRLVAPALREIVEQSTVTAASRDVRLEVLPCAPTLAVRADGYRLQQVLQNLIDNAVKFSPAGGVVQVEARAGTDGVLFSVTDEGSGVEDSDLPYLFDRFFQARKHHSGVGLGLAIARGLVEAHGGRIWAEQREGGGSVFRFVIPRADPVNEPEPAPALVPEAEDDGRVVHVLLADDDPVMLHGMRDLIRRHPRLRVVDAVSTGEDAVDRAVALSPDVVVLDLRMPGIGGMEAARRIHGRSPGIGIVTMSADREPELAGQPGAAGARFVPKAQAHSDLIPAILTAAAKQPPDVSLRPFLVQERRPLGAAARGPRDD